MKLMDNKFLKMIRWVLFGGLIVVISSSCMREPEDVDLVKYMLVQTEYDTTRVDGDVNVFNTYSTFVLKQDTMGFVSSIDEDTILVDNANFVFVTPVVDR